MLLSRNECCQENVKLKQTNLTFIITITLLFYSIAQALTIVFPIYMSKLGFSPIIIGLVMALSNFSMILGRPFAGRVIDQYDSPTIMFYTVTLYPIIIFGIFSSSIYVLAFSRAFMGLFVAFFSASIMGMFIKIYSDEKSGNGFSIFSSVTTLPTIYSSFMSLLCLKVFEKAQFLLGILIIAAINIVLVAKLKSNSTHNNLIVKAASGYKNDHKNTLVVFIGSSIVIFCFSIINGAIYTFLPLFLFINGFKLSGLYFSIHATTLFFCRLLFVKRIIDSKKRVSSYIFILSIVSSIATFILSTNPTIIFLIISAFLNGIAFSFFYPTLATFISKKLPRESISYYLGVFTSFADAGVAFGSIIMGIIAEMYSYHLIYIVCSIISILSGATFLFVYSRKHN